MNTKYLGDSYDIVKRFLIEDLRKLGYHVVVDPMFTDEWKDCEKNKFFHFLGASPLTESHTKNKRTALFLDPDKGVRHKRSKKHVTVKIIASHLHKYEVVVSFDQSFSFSADPYEQMIEKLSMLRDTGNSGLYYDSHARFLFAASSVQPLNEIEQSLYSEGLPESRLVKLSKRVD